MGKKLGDMPSVFGWELVLYEPSVVGSRSEGGSTVNLTEVLREHFFNFDPVEEFVGSDSDGSDSTVEVLKPQSFQQTRPAE